MYYEHACFPEYGVLRCHVTVIGLILLQQHLLCWIHRGHKLKLHMLSQEVHPYWQAFNKTPGQNL